MTDNSALRHECEQYGCARRFLDPKLERYSACFPGKISMGDIDGSVEINGCILWVEWKQGAVLEAFEQTHQAQVIQAKAFTRNSPKQAFVFVLGRPGDEPNWVWRRIHNGRFVEDWRRSGEAGLMAMFKSWSAWAQAQERAA